MLHCHLPSANVTPSLFSISLFHFHPSSAIEARYQHLDNRCRSTTSVNENGPSLFFSFLNHLGAHDKFLILLLLPSSPSNFSPFFPIGQLVKNCVLKEAFVTDDLDVCPPPFSSLRSTCVTSQIPGCRAVRYSCTREPAVRAAFDVVWGHFLSLKCITPVALADRKHSPAAAHFYQSSLQPRLKKRTKEEIGI